MNKKKRYALTLTEIMLVVVLIGIVGGTLAFNMKGAITKGKVFKTQETQKKIEAALSIEATERSPEEVLERWSYYVAQSPLIRVNSSKGKIVDGWGNPFEVEYDEDLGEFLISSAKVSVDGEILD